MVDIRIFHSLLDRRAALRLSQALEAEGWTVDILPDSALLYMAKDQLIGVRFTLILRSPAMEVLWESVKSALLPEPGSAEHLLRGPALVVPLASGLEPGGLAYSLEEWEGDSLEDPAVRAVISEIRARMPAKLRMPWPEKSSSHLGAAYREGFRKAEEVAVTDLAGTIEPYDGDGAYVFVCYAREDLSTIQASLRVTLEAGHNAWFDKGIVGGDPWRAEIARRIKRCAGMLCFLSDRSVDRKHVHREVGYADDRDKKIVAVLMGNPTIPDGLDMVLSHYQSLDASAADYQAQLVKALDGFAG